MLFVLTVCLVSLLSFSSCGTALEIADYPSAVIVSTPYSYGYYMPVYPYYRPYGRPYYRRPTPPPPPARRTPPRGRGRRWSNNIKIPPAMLSHCKGYFLFLSIIRKDKKYFYHRGVRVLLFCSSQTALVLSNRHPSVCLCTFSIDPNPWFARTVYPLAP